MHLIQDDSSPSFFLFVLEYNPYQAMLALESCPEKSYPQKLDVAGDR